MQIYPTAPSFIHTQTFTLGCQPAKRFAVALFRQDVSAALVRLPALVAQDAPSGAITIESREDGSHFFRSTAENVSKTHMENWEWPTVTFDFPAGQPSGAYVAVAYEVDGHGDPVDRLGHRVEHDDSVVPVPPDDGSMALIVGRPADRSPGAEIAYILPIATYHAYNASGGGCFYGYLKPPIVKDTLVSMRRPGGGLGALLGEPSDPYDPQSPRQQFTHWDAKFIRWLVSMQQQQRLPGVDYFTDLDMHLDDGQLSNYRLLLSVGHHEYWSPRMRFVLRRCLGDGVNYACFSGNSCYRPIAFDTDEAGDRVAIRKTADSWDGNDESDLIGLSYAYGGGRFGDCDQEGNWTDLTRRPYGFEVQPDHASSWVFEQTQLRAGDTFGRDEYLVGYEADGPRPGDSAPTILAQSPRLEGFDDLFGPGIGAVAALGPWQALPARGVTFNAGTADWARVLHAPAKGNPVPQITFNVMRRLSGGDD